MSTKVKSADELPTKPGIYIMKNADEKIIYIGKAKNLKNRVKSYFKEKKDRPKTTVLMSHFHSLEYIITNSEKEALILEANLIKKHRPKYNIRLKDDKRYPYAKLTNEDFPRLVLTRHIGKTGTYYGPFTDVRSVNETVKLLKSLFKIRTCKRMDGPCLNSQINLCNAPCAGKISKEEYNENISKIDLFFQGKYNKILKTLEDEMKQASKNQEFEKAAVLRDQINSIHEVIEKQFVEFMDETDQDIIATSLKENATIVVVMSIRNGNIIGRDDFIMTTTEEDRSDDIISAFIKQYYGINRHVPKEILIEENIPDKKLIEDWLTDIRGNKVHIHIPQKGTKLRLVRMARKNADIIKNQKEKMDDSLIEVKKYLKLEKLPLVIEGYDISNISGKLAVGSNVSFLNGKPNKKQYRIFKMQTPGPDDYGMMKELLTRRLKKIAEYYNQEEKERIPLEPGSMPDLILIDGGKGQLHVAYEVLEKYNLTFIPIIGLAKEFEEIFIPKSNIPIRIPENNEGLHLLQRVRDEAHRFGVTHHRKLRSKKITESSLDNIPGIGKKRKISLLKNLGSIDEIKNASVEELAKIDLINQNLAETIYKHFHP
ncbi:excinuclease ABC subunit UvrC [Methanobrevibacter acididurans]|uniref:excinuclease ABC subunit UvrC n=1 Tax=Methanobrevibacter acididurans TaxID=120963 RepID=UPI0038FC9C2F